LLFCGKCRVVPCVRPKETDEANSRTGGTVGGGAQGTEHEIRFNISAATEKNQKLPGKATI